MHRPHFDLVTPDGKITSLTRVNERVARAVVSIENINSSFVGFEIEPTLVHFNLKSILAQIGLNGTDEQMELDKRRGTAQVVVRLDAIGPIAREMLTHIQIGAAI